MILIDDERYGTPTQFKTLKQAQDAIRALGEEFEDVTLSLPLILDNLDPVRDESGQVVGRYLDDREVLRRLCDTHSGIHYESPEWTEVADKHDWSGVWPVVDGQGKLTGQISEGESNMANVGDMAMVSIADLSSDEQRRIGAEDQWDGYGILPPPPPPCSICGGDADRDDKCEDCDAYVCSTCHSKTFSEKALCWLCVSCASQPETCADERPVVGDVSQQHTGYTQWFSGDGPPEVVPSEGFVVLYYEDDNVRELHPRINEYDYRFDDTADDLGAMCRALGITVIDASYAGERHWLVTLPDLQRIVTKLRTNPVSEDLQSDAD